MFIVIEGLDGSGKTTAARSLCHRLKATGRVVPRFTYEPNDEMAAGDFIRQALRREIADVRPRTLALAFAANRLDHNDRIILPHLDSDPRAVVLCDRYYISSLVYQSAPGQGFGEIMELNRAARQPDVVCFLSVSAATCEARAVDRDLPPELFENKYEERRQAFESAIEYVADRGVPVLHIDGNGTPEDTVERLWRSLHEYAPDRIPAYRSPI